MQGETFAGFSVTAAGGQAPYVFTLNDEWPTGITVAADDGTVGGIPTESGTFTDLVVHVADSLGSTAAFDLLSDLEVLPSIPTLAIEALPYWWATTPPAALSHFTTLEMRFTFKNIQGSSIDFAGDTGGADPVAELQLWTIPSADTDLDVAVTAFPSGTYADGDLLTWELTIDLSQLPATETGFAIRPASSLAGTQGPDSLELVEAELNVIR